MPNRVHGGLFCVLCLFSAGLPVLAQGGPAPTLVQHVLCSNSQGNSVGSYDCKLPNTALSGNAIIVAFQFSDNGDDVSSVTVSDDQGDSYSPLVTHTDRNQIVNIFGAFNVLAGAHVITLTFSGGNGGQYVSAALSEFYNIANTNALDASSGHDSKGATVAAGKLSPTMSGDLIYQYAVNDDPGYCDSWTQGSSPWTLLSADWLNGQADQYQVQTDATTINPTLKQDVHSGTSGAFNSVAVALRPALAGTPPGSGIRIVHLQHNSFYNLTSFSSDAQAAPTIDFPASGNLLVLAGIMVHTEPLYEVAGVVDSEGNTWSSVTTQSDTGGDGDEQFAYAANAMADTTMNITLNMSTSVGESASDVLLFDIAGADSEPFDQITMASDVEGAGDSFAGPPIKPSTANGLCISIIGVDNNTLTAVTPGYFLSTVTVPEGVEAPNDNNNGWSAYYNPDTNPFSSVWSNDGGPVDAWGAIVACFEAPLSQQVAAPIYSATGDFDGDGLADIAVFRPLTGTWFIILSSAPSVPIVQQWGTQGDIPVPGDYDGDGKADIAVWRPSTGQWFIIPSSNPSNPIVQQWGTQGDIPVLGDYDGDGKTDIAVFRRSTSTWFIIPSSNPSTPIATQWGTLGDLPVPGDYDGDGKTDVSVFRPSNPDGSSNGTWFIIPSSNPDSPIVQQWGELGDIPVPKDYDGDGKTDIGVFRPSNPDGSSNGTWFIIPSNTPSSPIIQQWGKPGDVPVPKDYDGVRRADMAVWRPSSGSWFIIRSTNPPSFTMTQWGTSTDVPVR